MIELDPLERRHFEAHRNVAALDYAAQLVHVTGSMWEMQTQYQKWDFMGAGSAGNRVLKACRAAAIDLLESATQKDPEGALQRIRKKHLPRLRKATVASLELARDEQAAVGHSALMTKRVHARLLRIVREWEE